MICVLESGTTVLVEVEYPESLQEDVERILSLLPEGEVVA